MIEPGDDPLTLQGWLDLYRCYVVEQDLHTPGVHGMTVLLSDGDRLVIVDGQLPRRRRNETLWHEIAHMIHRDRALGAMCTEAGWFASRMERRADEQAAKLAIPYAMLKGFGIRRNAGLWAIPTRADLLQEIADAADVTTVLVAKRLGLFGKPWPQPEAPQRDNWKRLAIHLSCVEAPPDEDEAERIAAQQWHDDRGPTPLLQHDLTYAGPQPKAALYARSARLQDEPPTSEQITTCRALAADSGWHPVEAFLELGPAPLNGCRPEFDRMIGKARRGEIDVIVTSDAHHFASEAGRDYRTNLVAELAALGVKVVFVAP